MGHCIISGNSERTSVVGLLKITNQFYIGDLVECLYLSCIGLTVCGCSRFVFLALSFHISSHFLDFHHLYSLHGCLSVLTTHVFQG